LPAFGLNVAVLAITGQNIGAKNYKRVKEVYSLTLRYGLIILSIGTLIVLAFNSEIIKIFTREEEILKNGKIYFSIVAFALNSYIIKNISISFLQGLKKPKMAIYLGLIGKVLVPLLILPEITKSYGLEGIWWVVLTISWLEAIFTLIKVNIEMNLLSNKIEK